MKIKVAEVKSRIEHQLSGTDEVERVASHADNIALTVAGINVRAIDVDSAHIRCHANEIS